jgi:peptidoglycan/xylan/chitin deacetylase (PgdA/CDA1 family)
MQLEQAKKTLSVSIVIPAHNAAETIAETLDSLCAQTFSDWEAIVVDDGSSDGTRDVAAGYAAREPRIRLIGQPQQGVSAARNAGVGLARCDWLLFLDADDWVLPEHLERMAGALAADSSLDGAHCGWSRVAGDGTALAEQFCPPTEDLFPLFARHCAFAIHACVVRRSLVELVGGFDPSLRVGEDWDLWRRIMLAGARFDAVREVLACYRVRPGSATSDGSLVLEETLRVLERGFAPDPRVPNPLPAYALGMPRDQLPGLKLCMACWAAGLELGAGKDARPLLALLADERAPDLDPAVVARMIFETLPLAAGWRPAALAELWPALATHLEAFLIQLEGQSQAAKLARRASVLLERMILERSSAQRPLALGQTYAVLVEITEPIVDVVPPVPAERLHCLIEAEGRRLGVVELPICDGRVLGWVLADAIAAKFAWAILGRFFAHTVYHELRIERGQAELSIWRGSLCLASGLPDNKRELWRHVHETVGWTIFLQELWGRPEWSDGQFYNQHADGATAASRHVACSWHAVEVAGELADLEVDAPSLDLLLTVGGAMIAATTIPCDGGILRAQELRAALTLAAGMELCRAAVREGLIGRPLKEEGSSLRARLSAAADIRRRAGEAVPDGPARLLLASGDVALGTMSGPSFAPGLAAALRTLAAPRERTMVLGRHMHASLGTSVARRASLPAAASRELIDAAAVFGEAIVHIPWPADRPKRVLYAPEFIWQPPRSGYRASARAARSYNAGVRRVSQHPAILDGDERASATDRLPILMYHRVAPSGAAELARYRVTPLAFEQQLRHLRDQGYYSVDLESWRAASEMRQPLPGKAILITFDDGYCDFLTYAWPLLRQYGFSATVFLAADAIGRTNDWDQMYGEEVPLLGWQAIRQLHEEGVEFGSHSASHAPLTGLSPAEVVREGARARAILERGLGVPVTSFAYPYGDQDPVVQHLIGACGYVFGLTCVSGRSQLHDSLLALPRIEVAGTDDLEQFAAKLDW